jgi:hypothetical protein
MDIREFEDCLDRFGDDFSQWPVAERSAGQVLLASSSEARDLWDEAASLRQALEAPLERAPAGLADRIVLQAKQSAAVKTPRRTGVVEKPLVWARLANIFPLSLRPSTAFVLPVCFVVGILFGFFSSPEKVDGTQLDLPSYVAYVVDAAHYAD